ncbi:hypothetical protein [Nocardiopsis sp. FIRDI 009]|uniref:hypothetical protein n=1 Tax=Nocardiopsis sp. FIRDI 009 TaxID=714197 RepID=UPI000E23CDC9|nr:hypothetical protein [Nocardiopsis sp. FIRDI 009]
MTRRRATRRRVGAFPVVVLLLGLLLVYLGGGNVDRSVRALRADGEPGLFTAAAQDCVSHFGHVSCTCYGDYRSDDGSVEREWVYLSGGDFACEEGAVSAAVDIGANTRVYHPDGSHEWIATAALILGGLAMATWSALPWVRAVVRSRG